jgi:anthranilate phosphoribosyltransferase
LKINSAGFFYQQKKMKISERYNTIRPNWLLPTPSRIDEPPDDGLRGLLLNLMQGKNLTRKKSAYLLNQLLDGEATDAQISAALVAMAIKGETVEELAGMAEAMRAHSVKIKSKHKNFIDTAGTGSSRVKTFNVSTAAAFVIAGADLPVAKHGSRAATSKSGSADVLESLGVNVSVSKEIAENCLNEIGICFMFAPLYHASTARVAKIRRELGVHTTFNLLGPMTNPANAPFQIMGVWHKALVEPIAKTHAILGTKKAWIVHGLDGLDEITISEKTSIAEVENDKVKLFEISPEDLGFKRVSVKDLENLRGGNAKQNAKIILQIFKGEREDSARSLVILNSAAALYVGGKAGNFEDAVQLANESLDGGKALEKLEQLIEKTNKN